ncbi:MAG: Uma2 family endonuclease [Edaphobacter sp.]
MATSALIPVSEYLATAYRPDCDYVDGELQERNLGERDHSDLQRQLILLLAKFDRAQANPELRVQVSADRFRVPDICVMSADAPREQVVRFPPLLCIEILSPEDTLSRMVERVHDFLRMGVRQVWIFDPRLRTAIVCEGSAMVEHADGELVLPGTEVKVELAEVFRVLDE